ncbi:MAG TPA: sigma-70 family RNA polymerase sigma factor [Thermoanaerobaculia bacterium]|jgi:RNA polymerase sigma factor (sigma-70 family)|nr:sigma-70 family RNA polymerase sigma factor [Thermoanaerobaculia bacterium]
MRSPPDTEIDFLLDVARRMALQWCRVQSDAEDIAQEAILRYLTAEPAPAKPVPWLYVVIRRLSHRWYLRAVARLNAEARYATTLCSPLWDAHMHLQLEEIVAKLSERHRRVIVLLAAGAQSRDIAAALGVKVRDVGQMVARARRLAQRARAGALSENGDPVPPPDRR